VELLEIRHPFRVDVTTPHEFVLLDLKEVGEVRPQRDLKVEADGIKAVVRDIQILMDAFVDGTRDCQRDYPRTISPSSVETGRFVR